MCLTRRANFARFMHEREQMRAGLRLGRRLLAAALVFTPVPALAQASGAPTTNTPAADAIGPRDLQNFSIDGTVTRPADQQPATRPPARTTSAPVREEARPAPATTPRVTAKQAAQGSQTQPRQAARPVPET